MRSPVKIGKKLTSIFAGLLLGLVFSFININNTHAASILDKSKAQGLYKCYTSANVMKTPVTAIDVDRINDLLTGNTDENYIALPNGYTRITDSGVSCLQLLNGYGRSGSSNSIDGIVSTVTSDNAVSTLENLGYEKDESTVSTKKCVQLYYTAYSQYVTTFNVTKETDESKTKYLCAAGVENGIVTDSTLSVVEGDGTDDIIQWEIKGKDKNTVNLDCETYKIGEGDCSEHTLNIGDSWSDFVAEIVSDVAEHKPSKTLTIQSGSNTTYAYANTTYTYTFGVGNTREKEYINENDDVDAVYKINDTKASARTAMFNYFGLSDSSYGLSDEEKLTLYMNYLTDYYKADIICDIPDEEGSANYVAKTTGRQKVYVYQSTTGAYNSNCWAKATQNASEKVNGVDNNGFLGYENMEFSGLISALNTLGKNGVTISDTSLLGTIDEISGEGTVEDTASTEEASSSTSSTSSSSTDDDPCYNSGIVGMSWVLCPAEENMETTIGVIDGILERYLSVNTDFYDNDSTTHEVWVKLRDIANVIVAIVLVVVIFSQITGYGIDNYGIKRILPRLILMAIAINLSFIICQVLIDLSNILGVGLDLLFKSLGNATGDNLSGTQYISTVVTAALAIIAGAGTIAPTAVGTLGFIGTGGGVAVIVVIILALLIALVAVLMFFVTIAARELLIILCAAASPIAFACYILPNTQNVFKRWWKVFSTCLLIYPICGALYGVGYVIRAIVINETESLPLMMLGICAPYLPFFMLPTLLRGAISALGVVGSAMTAMSSGFRSGLRGARQTVEGTDAYKRGRENQQLNRDTKLANLDKDKHPLRYRMAGGDKGKAYASARVLKAQEENAKIDRLVNGSGFAAAEAGITARAEEQRDADAQALIQTGNMVGYRTEEENGNIKLGETFAVNSQNDEDMAAYHSGLLFRYSQAVASGDKEAQQDLRSQIHAAQNIMSTSDKGRTAISDNISKMATSSNINGSEATARMAASHMIDKYGGMTKKINRGSFNMYTDLASGGSIDNIRNNISNVSPANEHAYAKAGMSSYTPEDFAAADDAVFKNFGAGKDNNNIDNMSIGELQELNDLTTRTIEGAANGTVKIKSKNLEYTRQIQQRVQTKLRAEGVEVPSLHVNNNITTTQTVSTETSTTQAARGGAEQNEIFTVNSGTTQNQSTIVGPDGTTEIHEYIDRENSRQTSQVRRAAETRAQNPDINIRHDNGNNNADLNIRNGNTGNNNPQNNNPSQNNNQA